LLFHSVLSFVDLKFERQNENEQKKHQISRIDWISDGFNVFMIEMFDLSD